MRAAIYARISMDREGEGQGTERQLEDCRELIRSKGWTPVGEYVDNDISAYSGVKRPAFERMLLELAETADTLVVWKSDRLARRGRDLQRFLDCGATLTSCTEPEFFGSTGLLMLRILSGFAEHESGVKSERVTRKMRSKAERGDPHAGGARTYGFTADGRCLVPDEARRLQEATQRVSAGESLTAICNDWMRDGVATVSGGRWQPSNLSRLLQSAKLIGMRDYKGELFQGSWPPVLERADWERCCAVLRQARKGPTARKHILTGLLVCGRCGSKLTGGSSVGDHRSYACLNPLRGGCGRCAIKASIVEPYVIRTVLAALPSLELKAGVEVEPLMVELREVEAKVAQLAKDHYVSEVISRPAYLAANGELEAQVEALRHRIVDARTKLQGVDLAHVADDWESKSLSWRQGILRDVLESVTIVPGLGTRPKLEDRVKLKWRA